MQHTQQNPKLPAPWQKLPDQRFVTLQLQPCPKEGARLERPSGG